MKIKELPGDLVQIELTREELRILRDCVNEALELPEWEFPIRVGAEVEEVNALLNVMTSALRHIRDASE